MFNKLFLVILCLFLPACSKPAVWYDMNGKPVQLKDYHGKWVLINYWASWCGACAQEMPELNMFYFAHKDKDAMVFGVNYDHVDANLLPLLSQRMGVLFPVLATDPAQQFGVYDIPALPETFLIGPDGKLKTILVGEQTQKSLEDAIKERS